MSWIGGKKLLRDAVLCRFPLDYDRFIEVFGGGGWVLFHKPPRKDFEVYNDFNVLLSNLFRCVRDKPDLLITALRYVLNSRADFEYVRLALRQKHTTGVQRAAWFYQIIRQSYASGLTSFASQPHDMWANFPLIRQAHRRLKDVVIENQDFERILKTYDKNDAFFYLDPPYYETEKYYPDRFMPEDHKRLKEALDRVSGRFLLSYNDCEYIRTLYSDYNVLEVEQMHNLVQAERKPRYKELLIKNY